MLYRSDMDKGLREFNIISAFIDNNLLTCTRCMLNTACYTKNGHNTLWEACAKLTKSFNTTNYLYFTMFDIERRVDKKGASEYLCAMVSMMNCHD